MRARRGHRRRRAEPARHPAPAGRRGAGQLPGARDPGRLSPAGREDQRQAHRGDHPPDAAQGRGRRHGRDRACCAASSSIARVRSTSTTAREADGKQPATLRAGAAGHHQGVAGDRVVHLGGLVPGDHPRADRSGGARPQGRPARPEGKRHRRSADPGGHGLRGPRAPSPEARATSVAAASWTWAAARSRRTRPPASARKSALRAEAGGPGECPGRLPCVPGDPLRDRPASAATIPPGCRKDPRRFVSAWARAAPPEAIELRGASRRRKVTPSIPLGAESVRDRGSPNNREDRDGG